MMSPAWRISSAGMPGVEAQSAGVERLEADQRVDVQPRQPLGRRRGDLLDLDAARGRQHEERPLRAAVEGDREVVLALDVGARSIQTRRTVWPLDVHAEDRRARAARPRPGPRRA